jgi:hypothetical protein
MGNMGNPVSTRLGVNQFWYKHWYTDSTKTLNLKQDDSFEKLVAFYLQYGLTIQTNPFVHEYWYKRHLRNTRVVVQSKLNSRFYRRFFYTNDALGIEHSYLIRNKTAEYFPMRTWVLRYGGWLIFSVQWFKPLKIKSNKKLLSRSSSYVGAIVKATPTATLTKRVKLLILLSVKLSSNSYQF